MTRARSTAHGLPQDIAAAVAYVASPDSDFVTGEYPQRQRREQDGIMS